MNIENINTEFSKQFESRMCDLLPSKSKEVHDAVHNSIDDTVRWYNALPASISLLNVRQYFIQRFSKLFPVGEVLNDDHILSILLDDTGLKKIGETIELNGNKWKVIWRRFGYGFGIEFGLSNDSGKTKTHVFFD